MSQRFVRALASVVYKGVEVVADLPFFLIAVCVWIAERFDSKDDRQT